MTIKEYLKSTTQYPRQGHKKRLRPQTEGKMQRFQKQITKRINNSAENDQEKSIAMYGDTTTLGVQHIHIN